MQNEETVLGKGKQDWPRKSVERAPIAMGGEAGRKVHGQEAPYGWASISH